MKADATLSTGGWLVLISALIFMVTALPGGAAVAGLYSDGSAPAAGAALLIDKGGEKNPGLYSIWYQIPSAPVYRDDSLPGPDTLIDTVPVTVAGGESESFQIVFLPCLEEANVRIEFTDLAGPGGESLGADRFECRPVEYVQFLGRRRRDQWWPPGYGPRMGWIPDVLAGEGPYLCHGTLNNPFWITVTPPTGQAPGEYRGSIRLKGDRYLDETIPLKVVVRDFSLPEHPSLMSMLDYSASILSAGEEQYYYGDIKQQPKANFLVKVRDSRATADFAQEYFNLFHRYRITIEYLYPRGPEVVIDGDKVTVKFDEWAEAVAAQVKARGPVPFTIPNFFGDTWGWDFRWYWHGIDPATDRFARLFEDYCRQVGAGLKKHGWIDRCYLHLWNEIRAEHHGELLRISRIIRKGDPDLLIFTSTEVATSMLDTARELDPFIGMWKGTIANAGSDWYKEKRARGVRVQTNYTTSLGRPPLFSHHFAWRCKRVDADLFRDWAVANWIHDSWALNREFGLGPWPTPDRPVEAYFPQFPADGLYVYPNPSGAGPPLPSIRLALLRDAIDDYDYLTILEERCREVAAKLGQKDWADYGARRVREYCDSFVPERGSAQDDLRYHERLRSELAREIDSLNDLPLALVKTDPPEGLTQMYHYDIKVDGIVSRGAKVTVNGEPIPVKRGRFETVVRSVQPGFRPRYRPVEIKIEQGGRTKTIIKNIGPIASQARTGS
ncbi:glycoside hydrolase domain-containing protein [candidate division KSB1 bacterium]